MFYRRALGFLLMTVLVGGAIGGGLTYILVGIGNIEAIKTMLADQKITGYLPLVYGFMMPVLFIVFGPIVGLPLIAIFSAPAVAWVLVRGRCPLLVIVFSALWPMIIILSSFILGLAVHGFRPIDFRSFAPLALACVIALIAGLASREVSIRVGYIPR